MSRIEILSEKMYVEGALMNKSRNIALISIEITVKCMGFSNIANIEEFTASK